MAEPLRLGIVGVGALALRGLLPHLTQSDVADRVRVTALCDPVRERAQGAAEQYGVPGVHASLEELLAADEVDVLTIASPIGLHHEQAMQALARRQARPPQQDHDDDRRRGGRADRARA